MANILKVRAKIFIENEEADHADNVEDDIADNHRHKSVIKELAVFDVARIVYDKSEEDHHDKLDRQAWPIERDTGPNHSNGL